MGQSREGEKILREAVRIRTESLPKGHYWVALTNSALGECLTAQRRHAEAEILLLESHNALRSGQGEQHPRTLEARQRLVKLYEAWGKPYKAAHYR